jgi:hypothetical protein
VFHGYSCTVWLITKPLRVLFESRWSIGHAWFLAWFLNRSERVAQPQKRGRFIPLLDQLTSLARSHFPSARRLLSPSSCETENHCVYAWVKRTSSPPKNKREVLRNWSFFHTDEVVLRTGLHFLSAKQRPGRAAQNLRENAPRYLSLSLKIHSTKPIILVGLSLWGATDKALLLGRQGRPSGAAQAPVVWISGSQWRILKTFDGQHGQNFEKYC